MFELLFFIKLFVAIGVVVGLSLVAEHVSPKVAGIISGLPTGSAITLFFLGLEISTEFVSISALYNLVGMVASLTFFYCYYRAQSGMILSSLGGVVGYLVTIYVLRFIPVNRAVAIVVPIIAVIMFGYLFRSIPNTMIKDKVRLSHRVVFLRACVAAVIILGIIGLGKIVGPEWAGLLTAFPTTAFPLMLIVHYTYDGRHVYTIVKNIPQGLGGLITYSLLVSFTYPMFGVYVGTVLSFAGVVVYLLSYGFFRKVRACSIGQ